MSGISIMFLTECCVDGCYEERKTGSTLCSEHQTEYDFGKELSVYYGRKVKKKQPVEYPAAEIKTADGSTECESARRV